MKRFHLSEIKIAVAVKAGIALLILFAAIGYSSTFLLLVPVGREAKVVNESALPALQHTEELYRGVDMMSEDLHGTSALELESYLKSTAKRYEYVQDVLEAYKRVYGPFAPETEAVLERIEKGLSNYYAAIVEGVHIAQEKGLAAYRKFDSEHGEEIAKPILADIQLLKDNGFEKIRVGSLLTVEAVNRTKMLILALSLGTGFVFIVLPLLVTRSIVNPITRSSEVVQTVASGDLTATVEASHGGAEIRGLLGAMQRMTAKLQTVVKTMRRSVTVLDTGDREIQAAVRFIDKGIKEQQVLTDQTAESVGGMMKQMDVVAGELAGISSSAESALESTIAGEDIGGKSIMKIQEIARVAQESTATINLLKDDSQRISDIIQVIQGIADQTNLLALNAAIEAARAGDQGRGFAVVADEVRKLAQKTTASIAEISNKVKAIQGSVDSVVKGMEQVFQKVNENVEISHESAAALKDISEKINNLKRLAAEITETNKQAIVVTAEVNTRMVKVIDSAMMIGQHATDVGKTAQLVQVERKNLANEIQFFKVREEGLTADDPTKYKNCWEFKKCGKKDCAARNPSSGHDFLGGDAAGRACCFADNVDCHDKDCLSCSWYSSLQKQYGDQMSFPAYRKHMKEKASGDIDLF